MHLFGAFTQLTLLLVLPMGTAGNQRVVVYAIRLHISHTSHRTVASSYLRDLQLWSSTAYYNRYQFTDL
jgi:hypothetical protein